MRSIWSQSFHGKRICDFSIHLTRFNQGNTCNISWPSHQALCLVMASFMLYLHQMGVDLQNGTWYIIIVKGRLTLMAECKASPTSWHHLKFHSSSNKFLKLLFPPTKSYSPPSNPFFVILAHLDTNIYSFWTSYFWVVVFSFHFSPSVPT